MSEPPAWIEVRVDAPLGWEELVAEALAEETPHGTATGPASRDATPPEEGLEIVRAYIEERALDDPARARIAARLAALGAAAPELAALVPCYRRLPPEDWATSWEKVWRPFRVGRLCVQRPSSAPPPRAGDLRLALEPGAVFGSGRHSTTRACLAILQQLVSKGDRVLDAGTGTGILAVAAVLLGAESALGFDVDPASAPAARSLASDNGVAARCEFRTGGFEVLHSADRDVDGVLANIYADVLVTHARDLAARIVPRGWFVFSGVHERSVENVRESLREAGLAVVSGGRRGYWHTLAGRRTEARDVRGPAPSERATT